MKFVLGLNAPLLVNKTVSKPEFLPPDEERNKKLAELRDSMVRVKREKLTPLERGWAGRRLPGRKFGPPDPVGKRIMCNVLRAQCKNFKLTY